VGLGEAPDGDCLFLDLTGVAHLFGNELALARRLLRGLTERGLTARLAIADTLGAARAVVKHVGGDSSDANAGAKREIIIPPGQTRFALDPLPVIALRLDEETVHLLQQLGIFSLRQLAALPREELSARFGPQLLQRWDQALGRIAEPLPGQSPQPDFQAEKILEYPVTSREAIGRVLEELLAGVCELLLAHGRGALRLECRLTCQGHPPLVLSVGLFRPCAAVRRLFLLAEMQLERLTLRAPVTAIRVEAVATAPLANRQQELFSELPARQHPRHLEELIERLSSRLGPRAVVRPRLTPEAQPELAYVYEPLVDENRRRRPQRRMPAPGELPPRPLRFLAQPIPLDAVAIAPDGPPVRMRLDGHSQPIVRSWGPERIETGWWRKQGVGRDYYRVETATGQRFWVFRRLHEGRWFLQGEFE
jgi:protein ImuB